MFQGTAILRNAYGRLVVVGIGGVLLLGLVAARRADRPVAARPAVASASVTPAPALPSPEIPHGWRTASSRSSRGAARSIRSQLEALREGDFDRAIRYQSRSLRKSFPSVEAFRRTMESSYPQFLHFRSIEIGMGCSDERGRRLMIPVTVTGEDDVQVRATYIMIQEDGRYRVESVFGGLPGEPGDIA